MDVTRGSVFEPLGMVDTLYEVPAAQSGRVVTQHQRLAAAAPMQMPPINDHAVVDLLTAFERTVYAHLS